MKLITWESVNAFLAGEPFKKSNMTVEVLGDLRRLKLFGNTIAVRVIGEGVKIYDGGWQTNTTKERLNGLLQELGSPLYIKQKNWKWYIGNRETKEIVDFENGLEVA